MGEKQAGGMTLTEHELSEIRAFVEQRSGIVFDASRERFFSELKRIADAPQQECPDDDDDKPCVRTHRVGYIGSL